MATGKQTQNAGQGRTNVFVLDDIQRRALVPVPVTAPAPPVQPVIQPVVVQQPVQPVVQQPVVYRAPPQPAPTMVAPPPPRPRPVIVPKPVPSYPIPVEVPKFGPGPEYWVGDLGDSGKPMYQPRGPIYSNNRPGQSRGLAHVGHFDGRTFGHFDAYPSHFY